MITEDYVSFETAKLLKEKGFDADIDLWYDKDGVIFFTNKYEISSDWRVRQNQNVYLCPTLQMAMKWLREEKLIFVELSVDTMIKSAITWRLFEFPSLVMMPYEGWGYNYEEACEAGIKYCLENLI